jgi:hypothetical protein
MYETYTTFKLATISRDFVIIPEKRYYADRRVARYFCTPTIWGANNHLSLDSFPRLVTFPPRISPKRIARGLLFAFPGDVGTNYVVNLVIRKNSD